jgi:NAD(P)-dependent dehydrogenase (short-subunit alcohol dehydrogenase family)
MSDSFLSQLFSLEGKVALVTGGAVNIGRGISGALAAAGARVYVGFHGSVTEAADTVEEIRASGGSAESLQCDVSDPASVNRLFNTLSRREPRGIDILVNNSGILSLSPQKELYPAEWDRIFAVNVRGVFLCCREAARRMQRGSAVVNIASINALHPGFGGTAHYDASKGAVAAYTRSLAAELGPSGIRVNAVAPGLVENRKLLENAGALAQEISAKTPTRRLSKAEDIGAGVLFLASPAAGNITGEILVIDGGYLLS